MSNWNVFEVKNIDSSFCMKSFEKKSFETYFSQARALYDFEAQPGSGELSIFSGEILIVTR